MPAQYTRADSLREYLTGASFDGGSQLDQNASLGNYRSFQEALSLGITYLSTIPGVAVLYAGGANPVGVGTLTAIDANNLTWQPNGISNPGPATAFSGAGDTEIVEATGNSGSGQYLRVIANAPFTPGASQIDLEYLIDNVFAMEDISAANAAAGFYDYRATIIRNESTKTITAFQRYLATLGTPQTSGGGHLPASGGGTIIHTSGNAFLDWPASGWCQIRRSDGSLREVVYYVSRSQTILTVPASGRGVFLTTPSAGSNTDVVNPVPGIIIALDPSGVRPFGSSIQTIFSPQTAPMGVTWNFGLTGPTGLQIGSLPAGQQIGIWIWRAIPAGAAATPAALSKTLTTFNSF